MAHTLTIPNASTNSADRKQVSTNCQASEKEQQQTWKTAFTKFWNYTEEVSKSDTTSFKGIL